MTGREGEGNPKGPTAKQSNTSFNPSSTVMATQDHSYSFPYRSTNVPSLPGRLQGTIHLPAGVRPWLCIAIQGPLPDTIGQGIAHRGHDSQQLRGPVIEVQGTDPGQVSSQMSVGP